MDGRLELMQRLRLARTGEFVGDSDLKLPYEMRGRAVKLVKSAVFWGRLVIRMLEPVN